MRERGFAEADAYPYAPRDADDAIENYHEPLRIVGDVAGNFIAPRAEDVDIEGPSLQDGVVTYAKGTTEALDRLSKADLMGFTLPRKYGGINMPHTVYSAAIEMVSRADAALMTLFGLQDIAETILRFGDDEIRDHYLPRFASGEATGAMALTEPDAGSDLQAVMLKATPDPETEGLWRLSGVKRFITNGCADILVVLARSEEGTKDGRGLSTFVAEKGPGLRVRRIEDKFGIHGSPTCELQFTHCAAWLIGRRRFGLINGKAIVHFPAVADMLVQMRLKLELARTLTIDCGVAVDFEKEYEAQMKGGDREARPLYKKWSKIASGMTPLAKYYASEASIELSNNALQVLGGSGYMRDYPIERLVRDARITTLYEGTSQLQVVGALASLLGGGLEPVFEELAGHSYTGGTARHAPAVVRAFEQLNQALDFVKERGERDYTDYCGRTLTDMAIDVYHGFRLLQLGEMSEEKALLADLFVPAASRRTRAALDAVTSGERTLLDNYPTLLALPEA